MKLLYELAFDRLNLLRVFGTMSSDNVAILSGSSIWDEGEGRFRRHYFINGHFQMQSAGSSGGDTGKSLCSDAGSAGCRTPRGRSSVVAPRHHEGNFMP